MLLSQPTKELITSLPSNQHTNLVPIIKTKSGPFIKALLFQVRLFFSLDFFFFLILRIKDGSIVQCVDLLSFLAIHEVERQVNDSQTRRLQGIRCLNTPKDLQAQINQATNQNNLHLIISHFSPFGRSPHFFITFATFLLFFFLIQLLTQSLGPPPFGARNSVLDEARIPATQ